jgi:hypothetical protein
MPHDMTASASGVLADVTTVIETAFPVSRLSLAACRSDIADDFAMAAEDRVRGGSPGLLRSQSARDPTISVRSSAEWAPSLP